MTVLEMWLASFQQIWSRDNKTAICSFESSPPPKKKTQDSSDSTSQCHPMCVGLHQVVASARDELLRWVWQKYPGSLGQFLNVQVIQVTVQWLPEETSDWKPTESQTFPSCSGARVDSSTWLSNGWMMLGDWLWLSVFWARFSGHVGFSSFDESLDFIVRSTPTLYEHYHAGNKSSMEYRVSSCVPIL